MMSEMEALSEVIEFGWTAAQYTKNRKKSKKANALRHPSWHEIKKAKKKCLPDGIAYGESVVCVSMENALCRQVSKIFRDQDLLDWIKQLKAKHPNARVVCKFKYGADGSSAQSHYKNSKIKDNTLFASNMVPLFVEVTDPETGKSVNVWSNRFANSALGVVPLLWAFEPESTGMLTIVNFEGYLGILSIV